MTRLVYRIGFEALAKDLDLMPSYIGKQATTQGIVQRQRGGRRSERTEGRPDEAEGLAVVVLREHASLLGRRTISSFLGVRL